MCSKYWYLPSNLSTRSFLPVVHRSPSSSASVISPCHKYTRKYKYGTKSFCFSSTLNRNNNTTYIQKNFTAYMYMHHGWMPICFFCIYSFILPFSDRSFFSGREGHGHTITQNSIRCGDAPSQRPPRAGSPTRRPEGQAACRRRRKCNARVGNRRHEDCSARHPHAVP